MAITSNHSPQSTPRTVAARRPALITLITATAAVLAVAVFAGVWLTLWSFSGKLGEFAFVTPVVSDLSPALHNTADIYQAFDTVIVSSSAALVVPRTLAAIATALPFLIMITGCIGVMILARRLLTARPFTRAGQVIIAVLGGLATVSSALIRWCETRATELAVAELGLPTSGGTATDSALGPWVSPSSFDALQDLDWPLLALGVTLLLVAALWRQASRLQRDTEGLI
ncbi:hypothetical protein JOF28_000997 [Leucobacter exalbidus]|uniref:DUF2975 domain-containing protein n=1 Tax=Leucobacter exalbidus TaxID=662960 RepID=A0A940PMD3_9MICO|nr:hypothetical protein [Leucobacter exalbidus]MBP1325765.1 hypothetical protein [Leucobacter exalbidus]